MRKAINATFLPNKTTIHIDPADPPRRLAEKNRTVREMIRDGYTSPELRVCQDGKLIVSLGSVDEVKRYLREQVNIEPRQRT